MQVLNLAPEQVNPTTIIQGGFNIGDIVWTFRHLAPSNAVAMVGALLLIADYPDLWSQVANVANTNGDTWIDLYGGSGDTGTPATDTFGTPDLRGEFLRIADGGRGTLALELGESQLDAVQEHWHGAATGWASTDGASNSRITWGGVGGGADASYYARHITQGRWAAETRPRAYHLNAFMIFELL